MGENFINITKIIGSGISVPLLTLMFTSEVDHRRCTRKFAGETKRWYDVSKNKIAVGIVCGAAISIFVSMIFTFYERFNQLLLFLLFCAPIIYELIAIHITVRYRSRLQSRFANFILFGLTWILIPIGGIILLIKYIGL